ncbi:MAG: lipoprotein-releasing ABC transporter permease subunit [Alphaproteobacteria bacterium]|nr:lipoprotein-releasing ABC transporter permease subunit [Alphaproteobacteria bacterium]MCB1839733.1 lipoprotein-releasing ABC transporter permease subunit [Alphaproteobacteria bacterium]
MFSRFERMVAWRYLRSKKAEGFVSVIAGFSFMGILLGVATLIIVMSVMNGFREELFGRILGLGGHMNAYSTSGRLYDYNNLVDRLKDLDGIKYITPVIESQSLMTTPEGAASGVMVRALTQEDFAKRDILYKGIRKGEIGDFVDGKIAIGTVLANRYKLLPGDKVTLISPEVKSSPFGNLQRKKTYEVGIIFDVEMYEYNSGFIFMPLSAAQKLFDYGDSVSSLEIFLNNPDRLDEIRQAAEIKLDPFAKVYDWRDMNKSFFNALNVERNVMFLILSLIILVAAFNIISSMIMLVKDKGHDIAIMRTMGATRRNMLKIFILTGASIGFIGTFFGAALGIAFALNIEAIRKWIEGMTGYTIWDAEVRFLSEIPAVIDWNEVIAVIAMAFFLSVAATLYPAWRAARLDPVEAMRYE